MIQALMMMFFHHVRLQWFHPSLASEHISDAKHKRWSNKSNRKTTCWKSAVDLAESSQWAASPAEVGSEDRASCAAVTTRGVYFRPAITEWACAMWVRVKPPLDMGSRNVLRARQNNGLPRQPWDAGNKTHWGKNVLQCVQVKTTGAAIRNWTLLPPSTHQSFNRHVVWWKMDK